MLTPTAPVRSCTAQVSAAGRDLVAEELLRAWEVLESAADSGPVPHARLCAPPPLYERHAAWAIVSVRQGPDEGRFRGRLLTLLAALSAWADAGAVFGDAPVGRVRRPGGGRQPIADRDPPPLGGRAVRPLVS
ncbi:hypothetical protein ABT115_09685 [Streptomyces sp. NPDC001832]|uniref:hypothetical protein n=1 Tax=Streptomyces sp. NPDC001832 TaxID=3154527 RepID=UPI00332EF6B7